jgi:general secretion pathway protein C
MASRIFALIIWAAVAASLAYWGLRWLAQPTGVPANATPVSLDGGTQGELRRLLAGPPKPASGADQGIQSAVSALVARLRLLGVVAPRHEADASGVALLSIDGKPPRAVRVGGVIDGETVLLSLTQRGASIGPAGGPAAATIDLPLLPPPLTGSLPPPTGATMSGNDSGSGGNGGNASPAQSPLMQRTMRGNMGGDPRQFQQPQGNPGGFGGPNGAPDGADAT